MAKVEIDKQKYDALIDELQRYFENEREESLGILQARLLLDFILETIGPVIYNKAIEDMQKFLYERIDDMFEFEKR